MDEPRNQLAVTRAQRGAKFWFKAQSAHPIRDHNCTRAQWQRRLKKSHRSGRGGDLGKSYKWKMRHRKCKSGEDAKKLIVCRILHYHCSTLKLGASMTFRKGANLFRCIFCTPRRPDGKRTALRHSARAEGKRTDRQDNISVAVNQDIYFLLTWRIAV